MSYNLALPFLCLVSIPRLILHQTECPSEAKSFTVNGTLASIVKKLAPFWADPAAAATPDGKRVLTMLLSLVSSVCVFPPESEPVLPHLDQRLLQAFGALCASEPELYSRYPEVGGVSATAALEGMSLLDLCLLARNHEVDISRCDKTEVVRTLVASRKALASGVVSTAGSVTTNCAVPTPVASGEALTSAVVPTAQTPTTDRAALIALFTAAGGPSWKKKGWLKTHDLGTWHGVAISDGGGRVVGLNLHWNNLKGTWDVG